ncbi:hypothetical protein, partial [Staphylococcus aureus]
FHFGKEKFFLMIRRPPRSTQGVSSAASDVYKRQVTNNINTWNDRVAFQNKLMISKKVST